MARSNKKSIKQARSDIDSLRRSYSGALAAANKAIYEGIEQLAEHELSAIRSHYEQALTSLQQIRRGGSPRDLALTQVQMLQETMDRIVANARESLAILDGTRREVAAQFRDNLSGTDTRLRQMAEAAQAAAVQAAEQARRDTGELRSQAADTLDRAGAKAQSAVQDAATAIDPASDDSKPAATAGRRAAAGRTTAKKRTRRSAAAAATGASAKRSARPKAGATRKTTTGKTATSGSKRATAASKTPASARTQTKRGTAAKTASTASRGKRATGAAKTTGATAKTGTPRKRAAASPSATAGKRGAGKSSAGRAKAPTTGSGTASNDSNNSGTKGA